MQRFFPVIASYGIEELKVLSIQLLVLPMLKDDFEKCAKLSKCSESITTEQKNEGRFNSVMRCININS